MKRIFVLSVVIFCIQVFVFLACKKGSGILAPGYVIPTPTPTFTPDVNYTIYIHQQNTPVQGLKITLKSENTSLQSTTDNKGICGFKVNEYGKWILMIDTFDDFSPQSFFVEPTSNTFFAIDYGIPSLELNLVSGKEQIPIASSSITYTVKYHTKFEREKKIFVNSLEGIQQNISYPQTVANDGDELTIRLDIKNSFEGYTRDKKYLDIYAYTQGTSSNQSLIQLPINFPFNSIFNQPSNQSYIKASDKKITKSNVRTLTKDWIFNVTTQYYYMTLFDFQSNDAHVSYYAGIKNTDVSKSYNIPFKGTIKYEVVEFGNKGSGSNTIIKKGLSDTNMPGFTSYGSFNALAKVDTNHDEYWAWRDGMNQNGWLTVRFYDDGDLDVKRTFQTTNGWGKICYHWCCTTRDISRSSYTCKWDVSESCTCVIGWCDKFKTSDITRSRSESINITE